MALSTTPYNQTLQKLVSAGVSFPNLKLMLLNNTAIFDPTHTTLAQVAGAANVNQVAGNGWDIGGEPITLSVSITDTDGALVEAVPISVPAVGGAIGPAYKGVIYDDNAAGDTPLYWLDLNGAAQAAEGVSFAVSWQSGVHRITTP